MTDWLRVAFVAVLGATAVSACTMKNVNVPDDELMREFQAGQPMLDCSMAECGLGWMQNQQKAVTLEATGRWQELALFVMKTGFMDDLTYYYLGRAAQELGYLQAAQRYYRIAERLSVTDMACGSRPTPICSGHVFPGQLYPHLEVVEARLAAPSAVAEPSAESTPRTRVKRLVRQQPSQTPTATSVPASSQTPTPGFVQPAPAATSTSASGFVEPAPSSSDPFAPPPVRH